MSALIFKGNIPQSKTNVNTANIRYHVSVTAGIHTQRQAISYTLVTGRQVLMRFWLSYLHLTLAYYKGQKSRSRKGHDIALFIR